MLASQKIRRGVFAIWLGACLLASVALRSEAFMSIESATWDMRQRLVASPSQHDPKVKIIMVDQSSLDHFARREHGVAGGVAKQLDGVDRFGFGHVSLPGHTPASKGP